MRLASLALTGAIAATLGLGTVEPAAGAQEGQALEIYVSPSGDDGSAGSRDQPFQTIERARDAVRGLIKDGMDADVRVILRGGTYHLEEPLRLDERDSGRDGHHVIYTRESGEQPVVVGGRPITGWEPVDGHVYRAAIPALQGEAWTFNQLFVNDERATLAREPDNGYFAADRVERELLRYRDSEAALLENVADLSSVQVYVWPQRDWFSNTVAVESIDPALREVTFTDNVLHTLQSQRGTGSRYYVQGFAEALDQPGEWYLDRTEGYVYYRPADAGADPNEQEIVAPTVQDVFDVRGSTPKHRVHDIVIDGLNFSVSAFTDYFLEHETANSGSADAPRGTVWNRPAERNRHGIIRLENADSIELNNLDIKNAGFGGISIDEYSRGIVVTGNEIHEFGYQGVIVTGTRAGTLDSDGKQVYDNRDHVITDNHIHHGGVLVGHGGGVFLNQSGENLISHNRIHDMPRYGVCAKGLISTEMAGQLPEEYDGPEITWENHFDLLTSHNNVISFNDIYRVLQDSEDAGGVSFKGIGKGTIVENNHIHDYEVHRGHNKAVYLDDGAGFTLVKNNLVHGLTTAGDGKTFNITAKGYGNRVTNNILVAEDRDALGINSAQIKNEPIYDHQWDHNIFYAPHDRAVLYNFQVGSWFPEWVATADYNLAYSGIDQYNVSGIPGGATWDNWKTLADGRYDQHSLAADPLFVDPANDDYRLRPESPAFAIGIEAIDISNVGPRSGRSDGELHITAPPEMRQLDSHLVALTFTNTGDRPIRNLDVTVLSYTPNGLQPLPGELTDPVATQRRPVRPGGSVTLHWRADLPLGVGAGRHLLQAEVEYETVDLQRGTVTASTWSTVPPAVAASVEPNDIELQPGEQVDVNLHTTNTVDEQLTVAYTANTTADGITIDPAEGEFELAPGASNSTAITLTGEHPGAASVRLDLTASTDGGEAVDIGTVTFDATVDGTYTSSRAAFNNVGITDDADPSNGSWGVAGRSYSAQALAAEGITPGGVVSVDGIDFTWPDVPAGTPDNVQANGQRIALSGSGSRIGFLGTSDGSEFEGTGTIHYADGSTSEFTLRFQHWAHPELEEAPVAVMPYVNRSDGVRDERPAGLYFAAADVDPAKTIAAVELPAISQPGTHGLHVFAMAIGS